MKRTNKHTRLLAVIAAAIHLSLITAGAQVIADLDDILFWTGTGANRAGLVIDFNDGETKESFAWGFRWDGTATGAEMLTAVAAADPNFSILFGGTVASGFFMTQASYFDGVFTHVGTSGDFVSNFNYWGYYVVGGTAGGTFAPDVFDPVSPGAGSAFPGSWLESPSGSSYASLGSPGRILENDSWDGWSFGESPIPEPTLAYAAIPEPGSFAMVGAALCWFLAAFRRRGKNANAA